MGIETTKALTARRREATARAERLIAEAEERSPIGSARRARINSTIREGRRALTALGAAERALADLQARAGAALVHLTEYGLSRNEAYESLCLSRAVGRRLIHLPASMRPAVAGLSTGTSTDPRRKPIQAHGETGAAERATTKGIL